MITDADITKLKKTFATKTDLKKFATKEDLKGFATKEDLKKFATKDDLKGFATKKDLKKFATKDELAELRADMQQGFREVGERFEQTDEKIDSIAAAVGRIENTLDKFTGAIHDQQIENAAGAVHLARHDRQIAALAHTTGTTLPD